ncbi:MAG TPA: hypothetical protein VM029_17160 [Opitutaceae bacterium]|nr:hypothetical protein [Opitutaceae bacterium]
MFLLIASPLCAHNILTSWAEAKFTSDKIEITLTLARASAQAFVPDAQTRPPITPENFKEYLPDLRAAAPELIQITEAGKPVALKTAEVEISGDDINFKLTYPRPKTGPVKFFAYYLGYLVDGHVATLVISNAKGDDLGWSPLSMDQPFFQIPLPGDPTPKKNRKPL